MVVRVVPLLANHRLVLPAPNVPVPLANHLPARARVVPALVPPVPAVVPVMLLVSLRRALAVPALVPPVVRVALNARVRARRVRPMVVVPLSVAASRSR